MTRRIVMEGLLLPWRIRGTARERGIEPAHATSRQG